LKELAAKIRQQSQVAIEPMQLAALLLEKATEEISNAEAEKLLRPRTVRRYPPSLHAKSICSKRGLCFMYNCQRGDLYMKRVNADTASPEVKKFIRSLAIDANGVEVTLDGNVVCKIVRPGQLSDAEKAAQLDIVRQLLGEARANSKGMPAAVVERKIQSALKTVREGR
jgi:hypothetical protein